MMDGRLGFARWGILVPRHFEQFHISASACEHILGKHQVTLDEVLEAAESSAVYQRAGDESSESLNPTGEPRYLIAGRTSTGRRLWIIVADEGGGEARIITAREVGGHAERARHRRMRGD